LDAFLTNEILAALFRFEIIDAIKLIKYNFDRLKGFQSKTSYQKIPRDALRVGLLYLTAFFNK